MFRVCLVALLCLPAAAAPSLEKDLRSFDPLALTKQEKEELDAEVERRAESRYGKDARHYYAKLRAEFGGLRMTARLRAWARRMDEGIATEGGPDHSPATQVLCDTYVVLEELRIAADRRRDDLKRQFAKLLNGDPTGKHVYKSGSNEKAIALTAQRVLLRTYAYHLLELRLKCAQLLATKVAPDSMRYLVRKAFKSKEPHLRAKVAEVLSLREETSVALLLSAIAMEKDAGVRAALAFCLGRLGDRSRDAVEQITPLLNDPDPRVRVATARTLARLHMPAAVEPLVNRLGLEDGRARHDLTTALQSLTGERFAPEALSWKRWWTENKATILSEGLPPPGGGKGERAMRWKGEGGFYYGIPQISTRVIYILDISDSMRFVMEGKNRLERCVSEVGRAVDQLPRDATFSVLAYNSEVRAWKDVMVAARSPAKESAKAFIEELRPAHTTNIYDALRHAFAIAGAGAKRRGTAVKVDTIFLLSDGAPTLADATKDDPERILTAVRDWNTLQRITIHTIGIGRGLKFTFLQKLAEEHNGQFIRRDW